MTPRLMVICLGGLAGAGALVCCDLDEGLEPIEDALDAEATDASAEDAEPEGIAAGPQAVPVH